MALETTLLLLSMAASVSLRSASGRIVEVSVANVERGSKANVILSEEKVTFALSRNEVEYLQSFLLRAYRDGMADVGHVHVEGRLDGGGRDMDLTLLFELYRPPLSDTEAAKRMGE